MEITLANSYVLRGKVTDLKAPDKTLSKEGVAADAKAVGDAIQEASTGIPSGGASSVFGHIGSQDNPHKVTKEQLGLGNVDNTADLDKPVSRLQQEAIDNIGAGVVGTVNEHTEALKTVLHTSGGTMTGPIHMNGQSISGLNAPTGDNEAANKGYVDGKHQDLTVVLPARGWKKNTQTVEVEGVTAGNTILVGYSPDSYEAYSDAGIRCTGQEDGTLTFFCETEPETDVTANVVILN